MALDILLAFAQILIPISFAFPPILAFIPERSPDGIVMSLAVPILELIVTVGVAIFQLPSSDITAWVAGITIIATAAFLVFLYVRLGRALWIWDAQREAEARSPSPEEVLLSDVLDEIRNLKNADRENSQNIDIENS